jgi:hypothetical protein
MTGTLSSICDRNMTKANLNNKLLISKSSIFDNLPIMHYHKNDWHELQPSDLPI